MHDTQMAIKIKKNLKTDIMYRKNYVKVPQFGTMGDFYAITFFLQQILNFYLQL